MKKDFAAVGVLCLCNWGGIAVGDYDGEKIKSAFNMGDGYKDIRTTKVYTTAAGRDYFVRYGRRYYLDEFMRV